MQEEHVQFVKECFHFSSIHEDGNSKRHICHRPCSCLLFFYCNKISLGCLLFPLNIFSCNPFGKSQTQPTDSSFLSAGQEEEKSTKLIGNAPFLTPPLCRHQYSEMVVYNKTLFVTKDSGAH